jgi:hypothetical protein
MAPATQRRQIERLRWIAAVLAPVPRAPSDYAIVRRGVREARLLKREPRFYARPIAAKMTALAACLVIFGLFRNPWLQAANAVVLASGCTYTSYRRGCLTARAAP